MVALRYTATQLRFVFLLLLQQDAKPLSLYNTYERPLMKDFQDRGLSLPQARQELQRTLRTAWLQNGGGEDDWTLPHPDTAIAQHELPGAGKWTTSTSTSLVLDKAQTAVRDQVLKLVRQKKGGFVFVEGKAGSGKSTLATALTAEVEKSGLVLNVATTGVAALNLPHGATAHSIFGIPVEDDIELTCNIALGGAVAARLADAVLIQWDEWPSCKRNSWEAVLTLLNNLETQFGTKYQQKVVVCYGDFRQIPPVVRNGGKEAVLAASVKSSQSWGFFEVAHLRGTHRQAEDPVYARWLDAIGDGLVPQNHTVDDVRGYMSLHLCSVVLTTADAVGFCFPHLNDPVHCSKSKILAVTNAAVDEFNHTVLETLVRTYKLQAHTSNSADTVDLDEANHLETHLAADFLNVQMEPGVPPHKVRLVIGALYELMRNMNPAERLMNHTTVVLESVHDKHVVVKTLEGRSYPIPRICFRWRIAGGATTMTRRQYPLRPAYASTFNGCQGATLHRVVVDVRRSPFTHGHLYVALARVRSRLHVRVLTDDDRLDAASGHALTRNIVWQELLHKATDTMVTPKKRPSAAVQPQSKRLRGEHPS